MRKSAQERKAEILATALRLADELGPDRLTTAAIAEAVGLTQPGIFRHFPTKQALWHALAAVISARLKAAWDEALAASASPEGRIAALVQTQLNLIEAHPAIPAILFSRELRVENGALRQTFVGLMTTFHGILAGELARAREAGTVRPDLDPADGAVLLISLVQGLAMRWSLGARGFALQPEGVRLLAVQMALFTGSATEGKQS
ncbi:MULTISPECIES: TetR/AcrR family transcriptional regulator [Alphaproteobacteria]|jgi:AcrR family transcriptional regulator|uniref:TetR family transcriptional regulator n=2 Tax=Alphaproteobacteria TaxID=28211 RepID=A0A512HM68_9HYPH|nr:MULTISPECIES: TetR/AcrR family transcriptional regulator [Alphaproteobacteria]GEO86519.1 TetR family transcriptional regulator [Ciceribacter naphthalenivorans]GLR23876.1 TetR family transcriptional regulator [Ciceribacter naphthalenivorans]GLT06732.1 TetR family transcriptional regulator [Sphingomonas psychrolutea]